jgi:hypothetical protein
MTSVWRKKVSKPVLECMDEISTKLKVFVHPAKEVGFWAEVPALPGCVSEGDTWDETLENIW